MRKLNKKEAEEAINKIVPACLNQTKGELMYRIFPFILLLFISLQGQISQIHAADKTQIAKKDATEYPTTPEGVVDAEHRKQYEYNSLGKSYYYFLEEAKCTADCGITVNSFVVKKITQSKDKAKVMVEFDVVGTFNAGYIGEKNDEGHTLTKTKAGECHNFDIFKTTGGKFDYGVIYYDLVRKKDKWKIVPKTSCLIIYMSPDATIKFIEKMMPFIKDDSIKKRNLGIINSLKNLQKTDK